MLLCASIGCVRIGWHNHRHKHVASSLAVRACVRACMRVRRACVRAIQGGFAEHLTLQLTAACERMQQQSKCACSHRPRQTLICYFCSAFFVLFMFVAFFCLLSSLCTQICRLGLHSDRKRGCSGRPHLAGPCSGRQFARGRLKDIAHMADVVWPGHRRR